MSIKLGNHKFKCHGCGDQVESPIRTCDNCGRILCFICGLVFLQMHLCTACYRRGMKEMAQVDTVAESPFTEGDQDAPT